LPLTYGAHSIVILVMVSLNVLRRPGLGLFLIIIRLIALYLPLAYIGGLIWGITGMFAGAAAGNIIAGIVAYRVIKKVCAGEGSLLSVRHNNKPKQRGNDYESIIW
jgi:Na+-driven multidrug efflux pump